MSVPTIIVTGPVGVGLEEPFRRTPIGFDTNDHTLDIVVGPDLLWSWKDETVLQDQERRGDYSPALVEEIRREAAAVIAAIESGAPPFDGSGAVATRSDLANPIAAGQLEQRAGGAVGPEAVGVSIGGRSGSKRVRPGREPRRSRLMQDTEG